MEEQIKQAVEIAIGGTADYALKQQAIQFLNDLKSSNDGWQAFALLLSNIKNPEQVRFVALQAISESIPSLSPEQHSLIRNSLFEYLTKIINSNQVDQIFLKNKLAEAFASLFCCTYLSSWTSFFKDFEKLIQDQNEIAVDYYLRILINIHSEIGDQLIIRERPLVERNNALKDSIRVNDMVNLTNIWKNILLQFKDKNTPSSQEILKYTLSIIGGWVSWIEITLIVIPDYINLVLQFLSRTETRIICCGTLIEIVSKKMKPENKLELLSLLNLTNTVSSNITLDDGDLLFTEEIAKLYNSIGLELSYILDSAESSNDAKLTANQQSIDLFPFILNFLGHTYDDVSVNVFGFISSYLSALKKLQKQNPNSISQTHLQLLSTLFQKIIIKMKFDEEADGEDEDEISDFNEFRSKLKVFQDTIASINTDIYLEHIVNLISQSVFQTNNNTKDWREIELGLFELTSFSDSLRINAFNLPKNSINGSKPFLIFQELLAKTINSNVVQIYHPLIQLSFFELIVRHYSFLNSSDNKNDLTNHILTTFTTLGIYSSNEKVKLRSWYLFFRFIKLTKPVLSDQLIESLISQMTSDILIIKAELPKKDEDSEIVENSEFDSQLYLFETTGLLISLVDNSKIALKLKLIDLLLNPIYSNLQEIISNSNRRDPLSILQTHHSLMAIGTIARGFEYDTSPNKKYPTEIEERFNNTAEVVLVTLENLSNFEMIRDASRFSFARFIPILKSNINNHLSRLISILLASNNLKFNELTDFLSFIGQIVHNFNKDDSIYQLLNDLFTPLTNKVTTMLNDKGENNVYELMPDVQRDKASLKKAYITLLISLNTNHVSSLLITQTNKSYLPATLNSLLEDANNLNDLSVTKLALGELVILARVFGNDTVNDPEDRYGQGLTIEGISSFLLSNLVKLSFQIPFQNEKFDIKDAQFRFIADELANILKTLYSVKGQELISYLRDIYFPEIQLPSAVGDDLCSNLVNLDIKEFRKYFVKFVLQFK